MRTPIRTLLCLLALPALALAQWTPGGGGDHVGWDYTPPDAAILGGNHTGINNFTVLDGQVFGTGGTPVALPDGQTGTWVHSEALIIEGDIDAVSEELYLDAADSATPELAREPVLISPAHGSTTGTTPTLVWNHVTSPTSTYLLEIGIGGTAGPGGSIGLLQQSYAGIAANDQTVAPPLAAGVTYFWRVTVEATGLVSEVWSFTTSGVGVPTIALAPGSLTFTATEGGSNPAGQTFNVTNTGGGTLSYTITDNAAWLSEAPTSGTAATAETDTIAVNVDITGLAAGTYLATITVSDPAATNNPQTVSVTLTVNPKPTIDLSPTSLTFSAMEGGPNPAGQTFGVTNIGGAGSSLNWTGTDNGPWLTILPTSGILSSGSTDVVTASVDVTGLVAGTYSATITISDPNATNNPQTVLVTLNVIAVGTPPEITLAPTSLSYTAPAGGPNPAPQTFDVTNTGGGTLSYTITDSAPWLSELPASGALTTGTTDTITVGVDVTGLLPGTYSGTITVSDPAATNNPQTVAVTLTVTDPGASPTISVAPASLSFSATEGGANPPSQTFDVTNVGGGVLSYTITDDAGWASEVPASGTAASAETDTITVNINITGLTAGTYTGTITVSDPAATNDPQTVMVTLTITAAGGGGGTPLIDLNPTSTTFNGVEGGANPAPQTTTLTNTGTANLNWTATDDASWLTVTPGSGTLSPAANTALALTVNTAGLPAGTYTATVTVTDPAAGNSPQTELVTLVLAGAGSPAAIDLSPTSLDYTANTGGPNPAPQTTTLTNIGGSSLSYSVSDNAAWLSVAPASGALAPGDSVGLVASVDVTGLPAGTYTGTITVTDPAASNSPQTVAVTLTVVDPATPPEIDLDPTSLTFVAPEGGAPPAGQIVALTNTGGGTLSWTAVPSETWLFVSPTSGNLGSLASTNLVVTVDQTGLPSGIYSGIITVSDPAATNNPQIVSVTFSVSLPSQPPTITLNPTSVTFFAVQGGSNPAAQQVNLQNTGAGPLEFTVTDNQAWLTVTPGAGTLTSMLDTNLTLSVDITGLPAGIHTATITVSDPDATNNPQTVSVTLDIAAAGSPPEILLDPSALTFFGVQGLPNPTPQTITLVNTGGTDLSWTLTHPADPWLAVSPTSGSTGTLAPGESTAIVVSVDAAAAAVGVNTSTITLTDPTASNNPQVATITFNVAAAGSPAVILLDDTTLDFEMNAGTFNPPPQGVGMTNVGGTPLTWTATTSSPWIVLPAAGTLGTLQDVIMAISVDGLGLAPGTYVGVVTLTAPGALNSPQTITVTLEVKGGTTATAGTRELEDGSLGRSGNCVLGFATTSGGAGALWLLALLAVVATSLAAARNCRA